MLLKRFTASGMPFDEEKSYVSMQKLIIESATHADLHVAIGNALSIKMKFGKSILAFIGSRICLYSNKSFCTKTFEVWFEAVNFDKQDSELCSILFSRYI